MHFRTAPILAFTIGIIVSLIAWKKLAENQTALVHDATNLAAETVKNQIAVQLADQINALIRTADRWENKLYLKRMFWEDDANLYIIHKKGYQAIEWVDSSYYVRWVVPTSGNELVENINLSFEPYQKKILDSARHSREIRISKTIDLIQGGHGFWVIIPLFVDNQFDGFLLGVFHTKELINAIIETQDKDYAISIMEDEQEIYSNYNSRNLNDWEVTTTIGFYDTYWNLSIWPTNNLLANKTSYLSIFILIIGITISFLFALVINLFQLARSRHIKVKSTNYQLQKYKNNLEKMVDKRTLELQQEVAVRTQTEERLILSEARFREMADSMPQLTWTCLADGSCDYLSQQWIDYTGIPEEPQLGYGWLEQLHPDDRERILQAWQANIVEGTEFEIQFRIRNANGDYNHFLAIAVPLYDSEGTIIKWLGSITNISQQIQLQTKLRAREKEYHDLYEYAPIGFVSVRYSDIAIVRFNQALVKMVGYSSEELLQMKITDIYADTPDGIPKAKQIVKQAKKGNTIENQELQIKCKDGQLIWVSLSVKPHLDINGNAIESRSTLVNISELKQAQNQAEAANEAKSVFLSKMSHELRTPLNSLLILAKILKENKQGNLTNDQNEAASIIYQGGSDLLEMINSILDLSKIESGNMGMNIESFSLENLTKSIENYFLPVAQNKSLKFTLDVSDNIPETLNTDMKKLEQILRNLLSNSLKFTDSGKVSLSITLPDNKTNFDSPYLKSNNSIAFIVCDSGIGIAKENQGEIFSAFQQEDGSITRKYGGTGLGLSISRELSTLLGGEIHVKSKQGEGSCFSLYIPQSFGEVHNKNV